MVAQSAELAVAFTGGWGIVPPVMRPAIGSRSQAPRVLRERLHANGRYIVSLEGIAGRAYTFRVLAPDEVSARGLIATVDAPGRATVVRTVPAATERWIEITFPASGANADGYTAMTVSLRRR